MEPIHGDKLRGHLELLILASLERGEAHGLEILHRLEAGGCGLLRLKEGSLYPALQRLLKEELVKAEWSISSTNRRVRTYKLTAKGAKHLEHEVSRFEKMLEGITRVLAPGESS